MERAADRRGDATRPDWDILEIQARVRDVYRMVSDTADAFPALGPVVRIDAAQSRAMVLHTAWLALHGRGILTGPADGGTAT